MFDISKGVVKVQPCHEGREVYVDHFAIARFPIGINEDHKREVEENAEFTKFCFNLQQRLDIGCYEPIVNLLETIDHHIKMYDEIDSDVQKRIEQILNKAKK